MNIQRTLLERIRNPDAGGARHMRVSTSEVFESILTNLRNLLNTCQGNSLTSEHYGLPHLSEVRNTMPVSLGAYEAAIRRTVERHEPRLTGVRVRHSPHKPGGMELRFEIYGTIVDESGRTSVRFETYADDEGRLRVK